MIHRSPDDFTTQPSGNSGEKIACGVMAPSIRYRRIRRFSACFQTPKDSPNL